MVNGTNSSLPLFMRAYLLIQHAGVREGIAAIAEWLLLMSAFLLPFSSAYWGFLRFFFFDPRSYWYHPHQRNDVCCYHCFRISSFVMESWNVVCSKISMDSVLCTGTPTHTHGIYKCMIHWRILTHDTRPTRNSDERLATQKYKRKRIPNKARPDRTLWSYILLYLYGTSVTHSNPTYEINYNPTNMKDMSLQCVAYEKNSLVIDTIILQSIFKLIAYAQWQHEITMSSSKIEYEMGKLEARRQVLATLCGMLMSSSNLKWIAWNGISA